MSTKITYTTSKVKVASRIYFILFVLFYLYNSQAQKLGSDTLNSISKSILNKKISLNVTEEKLSQILDDLTIEYDLKFSYSGHGIAGVHIKQYSVKNTPLGTVLSKLFERTNFDYTLVGSIIVVTKRKTPISPQDTIAQSSKLISNNHIYTDSNNTQITKIDNIILKHLYHKEKTKLRYNSGKPTQSSFEKNLFIGVNVSAKNYKFRHVDNVNFDWIKDLNYTIKSRGSMLPSLEIGYANSQLMISLGINKSYLNPKFKYWYIMDGKNPDTIRFEKLLKYRMISIPIKICYTICQRRHYFTICSFLATNFIKKINDDPDLFERYYESKTNSNYNYQVQSSAPTFGINFGYNYKISGNIHLSNSITYESYITPYIQNSIYSLYPHSLSLETGIRYILE